MGVGLGKWWGLGSGRGPCLRPTGPEKALGYEGWSLGSTQQEAPRNASGLGGWKTRSKTPAGSLGPVGLEKC